MHWYVMTNNPLVAEKLQGQAPVEFFQGTYEQLLCQVRDRVHLGERLLTHPLSGSVKPRETPYKSVILSKGKGGVDEQSLALIENAIVTCRKFVQRTGYAPEVDKDFRLIDWTLLETALPSANRS